MQKLAQTVQTKPQLTDLLQHKVLHDNVLILPIEFDSGDVVVHAKSYEDKPEWGLVIAVGDGRVLPNGDIHSSGLKENDVVLFMAYGGTVVKSLGQDFIYVRQEDIISVYA